MWDVNRPAGGRVKDINFNLNTVNNPDHIRIGVGGINKITNSDKSRRELAQNSKIFDPATGTFLDKSVNDISLFTNPFEYISSLFDDPLVYATYITDENSILNSIDFMDSDDLEKSVAGTVAKNVASIIPMFIPYVNTAYSGLLVGRELAKTLPMAYGMLASLTGD